MAAVNWKTGTSGTWETAANWSTGTVPTSADTATIGVAGTYTVTTAAADAASSLTISDTTATLSISKSALTLGTLSNSGTISIVAKATLAITGTETTAGLGKITNNGTLAIEGTLTNTGATLTINTATTGTSNTLLNGTITGGTIVDTSQKGGMVFTNGATAGTALFAGGVTYDGLLAITGQSTLLEVASAGLTLHDKTGTTNGSMTFTSNAGDATLQLDDTQTLNNATITLGSAGNDIITQNDTGSTPGTLTLGSGLIINQNAIATITSTTGGAVVGDTVINQGTISATGTTAGSQFTINPYAFTNQGTLNVGGADTVFLSATNITNSSTGLMAVTAGGLLDLGAGALAGTFANGGTITVAAAGTLELNLGTITAAALGKVTNSGTLLISTATTLDNTGSTLTVGGGGLAGPSTVVDGEILNGTIVDSASGMTFSGAKLSNVTFDGPMNLTGASASLRIIGGLTANNAAGTGPGTVNLTGSFATLAFADSQTFDNATINLGSATNGSSLIAAASTNGETYTLTLGKNLTINQTGAIAAIKQNTSAATATVINEGTINANAASGTLTISPVNFTNTGTIAVSNGDSLDLGDGALAKTFSNTGTISVASGSRLELDWNTVTVAQLETISNSGTLIVGSTATIDNTGATITVGGGSFAGPSTILDGTISNGTIVDSASGMSFSGGKLSNVTYDGTINLSAASSSLRIIGGLTANNAAGTGPGTINVTGSLATLAFQDSQTIDNATINLGSNTSGSSLIASPSVAGETDTLTFGKNLTINQSGTLATIEQDSSLSTYTVTNDGTINAAVSGGTLTIAPLNFSNEGLIAVSNGDTVDSESTAAAVAANIATNFTNAAGGTITIGAGSKFDLGTNTATNALYSWSNAGTIAVGTGTLAAGTNPTNSGGTNSGVLTLAGGTITDAGTLTNASGGSITGSGTVSGAVNNLGALNASSGTLAFSGAVSGTGSATVNSGAKLSFSGSVAAGQAIHLAPTNAELDLAAPASFAGTIDGMDSSDTVDLTSVAFDSTGHANLLAGNVLQVTENGNTYNLQLDPTQNFTGDFFHLAADAGTGTVITESNQPCYCRGTLILTSRGEVAVEELVIGDTVVTSSGAHRPIKWLGQRSYGGRFVLGRKEILPVCITAGALAANVPQRDLWISPQHAMYLDGVLIEARDLVNGVSIIQAESVSVVEYFHIELDSHDVIIAEGALSESFIDDNGRGMFQNQHEYRALYPEAAGERQQYCAPRCYDGDEIETVRQRLAARAGIAAVTDRFVGRGCVDVATPHRITGWAQNAQHPEVPVCLDVYVGGKRIGSMLANRHRADLEQKGMGSGNHGFEFVLPQGLVVAAGAVEVRRSYDGATLPCSKRMAQDSIDLMRAAS